LEERRNYDMSILNGKKVIIIGDRDGIPGEAIAECARSAGADVVYSSTECFV
jgi:betaine reductase